MDIKALIIHTTIKLFTSDFTLNVELYYNRNQIYCVWSGRFKDSASMVASLLLLVSRSLPLLRM
jgi:hypothetical protein